MTFEGFSELLLATRAHYQAWLTARYMKKQYGQTKADGKTSPVQESNEILESEIPLF